MPNISDGKKKKFLRSGLPKKNSREKTDRNWWVLAFLCLLVYCFINSKMTNDAIKSTENNREFVYFKMYPNGQVDFSRDVDINNKNYFVSTVNRLFSDYITYRFSFRPSTVQTDYAFAAVFLSPSEYNKFISSEGNGGFGAVDKVQSVMENINKGAPMGSVEVIWNRPDHYDSVDGYFDGVQQDVMRSNIYFTRIVRGIDGKVIGTPEKLILKLQWRLIPVNELKKQDDSWLKINPIGIEIINQELIKDAV